MGLEEVKGSNFTKIVTMLEGMLSDEYPNYKLTIDIVATFFDSLDQAAFDSVIGFVDKIINFR